MIIEYQNLLLKIEYINKKMQPFNSQDSNQTLHGGEVDTVVSYHSTPLQQLAKIPPLQTSNLGSALRAPEFTNHLSSISTIKQQQQQAPTVRLKQNGGSDQAKTLYQAKQGSVTGGMSRKTSITPQSNGNPDSASKELRTVEKHQRGSSKQFIQFADRLLGAINNNIGQDANVNQAILEANGYNIVASKSAKMLPAVSKQNAKQTQGGPQNKFIQEQQNNLDKERMRVSQSFKSILQREQARDEQLATRLKKINEKQADRIKEIETKEKRNQQDELEKMVNRTSTYGDLKPSQSQKILDSIGKGQPGGQNLTHIAGEGQQVIDPEEVNLPYAKTQRQSFGSGIEIEDTHQDQRYSSSKKEYFNNNSSVFKIKPERDLRNEAGSFTVKRNKRNDDGAVNNTVSAITRGITNHNVSTSAFSNRAANVSKAYAAARKDRQDVSFLHEKNKMIVSQNGTKNMPLESKNGALLSQSQLTTGNEGRDDYMEVALSLRHIGKSIMQMPKTLDDLRVLSREYMRNLGVTDDMQDEQTYLQYIEDHLKAQEKATAQGESARKPTLSPIRNLADFYQRKLNKIQTANDTQSNMFQSTSKSPRRGQTSNKSGIIKTSLQNKNQTYVDIEHMTVAEMEKLEQSPPRINPKRKNMKVVNNKAMIQFGQEAFNVQIDDKTKEDSQALPVTRLAYQRHSSFVKSPSAIKESKKEMHSPNELTPPRTIQKKTAYKSSTHRDTSQGGKKEGRDGNKQKLLQSLNDVADQLTKPSIALPEDQRPIWLQKDLKEEAAKMGLSQANLGKPSSRQDAILLAKWFKGTIDMIENEYQTSQNYYAKQGQTRTFPTQKAHEQEISQTDQYLLIQIAHNIAIKEITRQVSVYCIERGILLKTVFDSYVRMVDLIFVDSVAQRKILTQRFASVCEKQVFYQAEQIRKKDAIIEDKDAQIAHLKDELALAADRESALKFTNKKLANMSHRSNMQAQEYQRLNTALERQVSYLENRIKILLEMIGPEKATAFNKETRRTMHKIESQADIDHARENVTKKVETGEVVNTLEMATDMNDHKLYLEELNGGPLEFELQMQTSYYMDEVSNSVFDLYEVGAIEDKQTMIDPEWRRQTRPKRIRPMSANDQKKDKRLELLDNVSFDTSSHHTIDYLLEDLTAKSWTFGQNGGYVHMKKQRPMKRSLSHGNFNWNLIVDRIDIRLDEEAKANALKDSGSAMARLIEILGKQLLEKIKKDIPELYDALMDYIEYKKGLVTVAFCRDILAQYNLDLDEERRQARLQYGMQFRGSHTSQLNDSQNDISANDESKQLNLTNMSDMLKNGKEEALKKNGGQINLGGGRGSANARNKKKDHMYQFVEWNFSKRSKGGAKKPVERLRKDHPSFNIITKLMDKHKAGKEIKELMAVKSAVRYIYNVYMGKAAEFAAEKANMKKQGQSKERTTSISPENLAQMKKDSKLDQSKKETVANEIRKSTAQSPSVALQRLGSIHHSPNQGLPTGLLKLNSVITPKSSQMDDTKEIKKEARSKSPKPAEAKGQDLATNVNLIEWTYEYFQNRYGLKTVADKKFNQFIGSVLRYKTKYPRFRLFGRFLGLYDELTEQDLKLYVDIVHNMFKSVLNFQIQEQDDLVLVPTTRACDYFKTTFATRLTTTSMTHCLKIIRQKQLAVPKEKAEKYLHLNSCSDAVQLDEFSEFVIHTTKQLQSEKLQNITEIFMAADLNNNNILEFNELKTLYKLLCNQYSGDKERQLVEIRNLFNEYSKVYTNIEGSEGIKLRGVSYESFEKLCLDKDVFTIRQQNSFINAATKTFLNVTDNQETFTNEFEKLSTNLDDIYQRLSGAIRDVMDSKVVPDADKERYQDMVEQMVKAIMNPINKKVAFLTFKIVEETVKRICLKVEIDKLMPVMPECIASMKKSLAESSKDQSKKLGMKTTNQMMMGMKEKLGQGFLNMLQPQKKTSDMQVDKFQDQDQQSLENQARQSRQSRFRSNEAKTLPVDDGRNQENLKQASITPERKSLDNKADYLESGMNKATINHIPSASKS